MEHSYVSVRLLSILALAFLCCGSVTASPAQDNSSAEKIYKEGIEKYEIGEFETAVEVWARSLEQDVEPDYSIGFYMIKTVTAHNLRDYYEKASEAYYRGLETTEITEETKALIEKDLEFIRPMLGMREARRLNNLLDEKNPEIFTKLKEFWDEMRISVSGSYNERLLEHWERCNYVMQNFATAHDDSFDQRGDIYLKFGNPSMRRDGTLLYNSGFAEHVLSARMSEGGSGVAGVANQTAFLNTSYMVRNYHEYPQFEVWVYRDLADSHESVVYLFGNTTGSNVMSLKKSPDDFVPSAAFSTSGRNRAVSIANMGSGGSSSLDTNDSDGSNVAFEGEAGVMSTQEAIPPGLVLQLMYYRQLAAFDDYFSSRYTEMMDRYMSTSSNLGSQISREFQHVNTARILRRQGRAPSQRSAHVNEIFSIDSGLYAYRFLDDEMEPYLKVYLDADSEEAISYEELRRHNNIDEIDYNRFEIINRLRSYNGSDESLDAVIDTLQLAGTSDDPLANNMIKIPQRDEITSLRSNFELHNREEYGEGAISENTTLRKHLKGIGAAETEIEERLPSGSFISSDIILGYSEVDSEGESEFIVSHNKMIPKSTNLNFYYEAYNLPLNDEGLYSFTLTYEIARQRSFFGRVIRFGRSSGPSITIENTEDSPRFSQILEIVAEELETGDYTLNLRFMTTEEEILHERKVEFSIY